MSDFDDWAKGKTDDNDFAAVQSDLAKLRKRFAAERRSRKKLESALILSERRLEAAIRLSESAKDEPEFEIAPDEKSDIREGTAIIMASDWHVEETVDPSTVNNVNEYNPEIAKRRSEAFFRDSHWWLKFFSKGYKINEIVLWLGGDMISGYIHDELVESNEMSPTEASLLVQSFIRHGMDSLLKWMPNVKISVVCSYGNHGRTTVKRRHSTGAKNSYEWLMYHHLKQLYEGNERVRFQVANGSHSYMKIYDWTFRFHHGDDVRFQGGVGGLSVPLGKALSKWDTVRHADHTIIGHWHQLKDFDDGIVNGSLIGYNAFALSIKAKYEPPRQGFLFIDRDRGKLGLVPLYVEEGEQKADSIDRRIRSSPGKSGLFMEDEI
jgi:hypothetical protein